jgi:Anaphase-promoting complex subunit 4 WD40 domain
VRPGFPGGGRRRSVEIRFPVADGDEGLLWTLRLERVAGRPGLWAHPDDVGIAADPVFEGALQTAMRWAVKRDPQAERACVRWRVSGDGGDPRATGGSVGAAAAVGLAYLLGLGTPLRAVDKRYAISATVTDDGLLGSVSGLPAKLTRGGAGWRRLVVSAPDEEKARRARQGDWPKVEAARDVTQAARRMARPWMRLRTGIAGFGVLVLALGGLTWYLAHESAAENSAAQVSQRHRQASHLASVATGLAGSDPAAALRLAVAATRTDPGSAGTQAALMQVTQAEPRITAFLGSAGNPAITRLASSASGDVAVSANAAGNVESWRPSCASCQPATVSRGAGVSALAISPDGGLVAVARGNTITLTTPAGRAVPGWPAGGIRVDGTAGTLAISDDATQVAAGTSADGVWVWTRHHDAAAHAALGAGAIVSAEVFLPDGRLVTGTSALQLTGHQDLSVWDTADGSLARTVLRSPAYQELFYPGVRAMTVVGSDLVLGETYLEVRPLAALNTVRTLSLNNGVDAIVALDATHVAVGTTLSVALAVPPLKGTPTAPGTAFSDLSITDGPPVDAPFSPGMSGLESAAARGPGGTVLDGTTAGTIVAWRPAVSPGAEVLRVVPDPLSRSGIIASRADGSVVAFNASSGRLTTLIPAGQHGAAPGLAADGGEVLAGYEDGTVLRLDRGHPGAAAVLLHVKEQVTALGLSPSGSLLAVGGSSGQVLLYHAATGKLVRTLPHPHAGWVYTVSFSPSGGLLASGGVQDGVLVQSVSGSVTESSPMLSAGLLVWQPGGSLLAGDAEGSLYQLQVPLAAHGRTIVARPDSQNILGGALDPSGRLLVIASADQSAVIVDPRTGQVLGRFSTLDGTRSGTQGGEFPGAAWAAAFTQDGEYAVFGTQEGNLQVIMTGIPALQARACALAPLPPVTSSVLSGADLAAAQGACR